MPDIIRHQARPGRSGWVSYARILRTIHDGTRSTEAIARANERRTETMREILRRMASLGLVHISGAEQSPSNHQLKPLWSLGQGEHPDFMRNNKPMRPTAELIATACMLRAMSEAPRTIKALSELAGVQRNHVERFIRALHVDLRMVFIAQYKRSRLELGATPAAMYRLGFDMQDAQRPAPMSPREMHARQWARRKANKQRLETIKALAANAYVFHQAA